jgi:hypothetical protein
MKEPAEAGFEKLAAAVVKRIMKNIFAPNPE